MGYKYSFFDNQLIGADELNKALTYMVAGNGVSPVFNAVDGTYPVSQINDINLNLVAGGVVPASDSTCCVTKIADGEVFISPGVAFFDNGTTIEIDSSGEVLNYTAGVVNYIYLISSMSEMKAYPACTMEEMTDGADNYYILLAEISAEGAVTDRRIYAKGKVPGVQSTAFAPLVIENALVLFEEFSDDASYVIYNKLPLGENMYENLLAIGYRKINDDLYWDKGFLCYMKFKTDGSLEKSLGIYSGNKMSGITENISYSSLNGGNVTAGSARITEHYLTFEDGLKWSPGADIGSLKIIMW